MDSGDFLCPQCATNRNYKHKKVTRFFTLYFIPLIPLGQIGDYVGCQTCKCTFVSRVLEYNPQSSKNEFQALYEKAMRHSMILIMLADGIIDENEMVMVHKIINKFSHNDITMDELELLVAKVQREQEPIGTYLSKVTPSLNEHSKETIIKCGLAVAHSDGHFDDSEKAMIKEMAEAMEMSSSHLRGIMADTTPETYTYSDN